ncbi:kinase-like domain-containing protein [Fomes fomentarius]|nr:kinase-like domain-containing protein [Fomes fomentarius]
MSESTPSSSDRYDVYVDFTSTEIYWRDRQEFFLSHGYMFRPRYRPGWIPSWRRDPTVKILYAEDRLSFHLGEQDLMDARRLVDGKQVIIKKVPTTSNELRIATHLSSPDLRKDPRNHCVPILEVMPLLRYIDQPEFDTVGCILDCVEQLLEGLVFLHEHNVAHRDCAYRNIMMDPTAMYPLGFHPIADLSLPDDVTTAAPVLARHSVPVTYYFVDFGISTIFNPNDPHRLVTGRGGLDQDVPELSEDIPYDPFKVDVFILGNLFRELFLAKFASVDMLSPLLESMLKQDPADRPGAVEALEHFRELSQGVWTVHRLWRARRRDELFLFVPIYDTAFLLSAFLRTVF